METLATRRVTPGGVPLRWLAAAALVVLAVVAGAILAAGSRKTSLPAPAYGPADNGRIVYGEKGQLYVRDTLTGQSSVLVSGPDHFAPEFSRDGTKLAYVGPAGPPGHEADVGRLWVANADGSDARPLQGTYPNIGAFAWSPGGDALALTYDANAQARPLVIVPTDGSAALTVVSDLQVDQVAWRPPDGRQLVIRARRTSDVAWTMWLVGGDGSDLAPLDLDPGFEHDLYFSDNLCCYFEDPAWSPDGRQLAYHTLEDVFGPGDGDPGFRVHVADIGPVGAVSNERQLPVDVATDDEFSPVWTGDGRIVVRRLEEGVSWIAIYPTLAGPAIDADARVGDPTAYDWPSFVASPDGTTVFAWQLGREGTRLPAAAWRIDTTTGKSTPIDLPIDDWASWQRVGHPGG